MSEYIAAARSPPLSEHSKHKIFPSQAYTTQRIFRDVVVYLDGAVVTVQRQRGPLVERVVDRLGRVGLRRQRLELRPEPGLVDFEQRFGLLLPHTQPFGRRLAADAGLDAIEFAD